MLGSGRMAGEINFESLTWNVSAPAKKSMAGLVDHLKLVQNLDSAPFSVEFSKFSKLNFHFSKFQH